MNITVYLGSSYGNAPAYRIAAARLGRYIASRGDTLVYGGSRIGLMGILAQSVVENGGSAIGVEPRFFVDAVVQYEGLSELIVTETMAERKTRMIEMGDAFIAFPGGTGTLEEISEIISLVRLGRTDAPCILLNLDGYYEPLRAMLEKMVAEGFLPAAVYAKIRFISEIEELDDILP